MAELTDRPFPPGSYPVVVVGSGPGALQVSYCLTRFEVPHAVLSADDAPGGMFRRWPFFQRLLSWTKPFAPVARTDPAYQRYDWNSLLADEPEHQAIMPDLMDGEVVLPVASGDAGEPRGVRRADRHHDPVRLPLDGHAPRGGARRDGRNSSSRPPTASTGRRPSCSRSASPEPSVPDTPGIEHAVHYGGVRPAETYAGQRVFIIGKQNSGFELASGLLQWARAIVLASPSPAKLSVNTKSLVGVRARYVQPIEDHALGGGVTILDAAIGSISPLAGGGFEVVVRPTGGGDELRFEVDEVIAATGFVAPILDLPALGVTTFGQSRLPAQSPYWESVSVPGAFFAGTIGQGAPGLKKHGLPSNSGAVHGARYNARVLARRIAATRFSSPRALERPSIASDGLVDWLAGALRRRRSSSTSGRTSPVSPRSIRPAAPTTRASCRWRRSWTRPETKVATRSRRPSRRTAPGRSTRSSIRGGAAAWTRSCSIPTRSCGTTRRRCASGWPTS